MKEALLHMLFVGVVLFAASYLKKNTATVPATQAQTRGIIIDSNFQRTADSAPALALVRDTVKLPRRK